MALFNIGKKKETQPCSCCNGNCSTPTEQTHSSVKVLGGGCKNCHTLQEHTQQALQQLQMDSAVELITDPSAIVTYGVMSTPALVVDEKVVSTGRVLTVEQAVQAIQNVRKA